MRGHVIRPLQCVGIERVVFRHESVQPVLQVDPGAGIVVFLNEQTGRRVANEQGAKPFVSATAADNIAHGTGKGMQALTADTDVQLFYQCFTLNGMGA